MHAELKGLDTGDAEGGELVAFCPDDAAHFALRVTASIGPAGQDSTELFQFEVCSPELVGKPVAAEGLCVSAPHAALATMGPATR